MKNLYRSIGLLMIMAGLAGCEDYLNARPDKKLVVPASLQDVNAILDYTVISTASVLGEGASDNMYHSLADWNSIPADRDRRIYTWQNDAADGDAGIWAGKYNHVFIANTALQTLEDINPGVSEQAEWKRLKGSALFFRSYAFFELAQLFAKPYDQGSAAADPGVPLKLSPDINEKQPRASLEATYQRILGDLKEALPLLPQTSSIATRPNKASAYGMLARVYLNMGNYENAGLYADSSLALYNELLDYNTISINAAVPFSRFNKEVIFHCTGSSINLNPSRSRVDTLLYRSYAANDLRKSLFYRANADGTYAFKGNYDGQVSSVIFAGITTAELYLIRSECRARSGATGPALQDLNTLMVKRWKQGTFSQITAATPQEALTKILSERRKELAFRGMRWNDLRRLNKEPAFATTLMRKLGTDTYTLPPNDPRYVFPISDVVINLSGIEQNIR